MKNAPKTDCVLVYNEDNNILKNRMLTLAKENINDNKKPLIMCLDENLDFFKNEFRGTINIINMGANLTDVSKNVFTDLRKVDEYDVDFNEMRYSAGMEIELPEHDAQWLKNLKVAEDIKTSAMVTKPTEDK